MLGRAAGLYLHDIQKMLGISCLVFSRSVYAMSIASSPVVDGYITCHIRHAIETSSLVDRPIYQRTTHFSPFFPRGYCNRAFLNMMRDTEVVTENTAIRLPENYFPDNDPKKSSALFTWRTCQLALYRNWINWVYPQMTPLQHRRDTCGYCQSSSVSRS